MVGLAGAAKSKKELTQACCGKIVEFNDSGAELDDDSARRVRRACKRTCLKDDNSVDRGGRDRDGGGGTDADVTTPPEVKYAGECTYLNPCPRCAADCGGSPLACADGLVCLDLDDYLYDTESVLEVPGCLGATSGATGCYFCVRPEDVPGAATAAADDGDDGGAKLKESDVVSRGGSLPSLSQSIADNKGADGEGEGSERRGHRRGGWRRGR